MNKGFTLIELICVITILGLIALIAVPTVNTMIQNSKEDAYEEQIVTIEKTAKTYMSKNSLKLPSQQTGSLYCVSIDEMQKAGLLSKDDIKNPLYKKDSTEVKEKNENFTGGVNVKWNGKKYTYEYVNSCG